jgi:dTDP-4-amino-4,6-dideoxygalactose transaminase
MIRLSKSIVGKNESQAVSDVINNVGYLGMGTTVHAFEQQIEKYLNASDNTCCCTNTGTSALHLAIQSITKPGDEILVPSFTYVATYQAITAAGCVPISCDIDPDTFLLDLKDAVKRITPKTKALVYVQYASNTGDLNSLYSFGKQYNMRIVEDAAHAFGCTYNGNKIGSFGDIVCFSFDGIKNITSGEGGAIVTKDEDVLSFARDARLLGVVKDTEKRYTGERSWDFDVNHQGYRYHMSNIFAAIGLVQLTRLDTEFAPKRKQIRELYQELLSGHPEVTFQKTTVEADIIPHIMPVRITNGKRDHLFALLLEHNIQVGIHYKPNHLLQYFKASYALPNTERLYEEIISLPLHPEVTEAEVKQIVSIIIENI